MMHDDHDPDSSKDDPSHLGPRAVELTGLRIRDHNLKAGHVEVSQTLQYIAGELVVGTPKSAQSIRNVPLVSRALLADLRKYLLTHPYSGDPDAQVPKRVVSAPRPIRGVREPGLGRCRSLEDLQVGLATFAVLPSRLDVR